MHRANPPTRALHPQLTPPGQTAVRPASHGLAVMDVVPSPHRQLAEDAPPCQRRHDQVPALVAVGLDEHVLAPACIRSADQGFRLPLVHRRDVLAENVLPRVHGRQCLLAVHLYRGREDDHIDVRPEHLVQGGAHLAHSLLRTDPAQSFGIDVTDRAHCRLRHVPHDIEERAAHSQSDEADLSHVCLLCCRKWLCLAPVE